MHAQLFGKDIETMSVRVGINGLWRIGRATLKIVLEKPELDLVALNDIAPPENLAYLLRYDTVYGRYEKTTEAADGHLSIDGRSCKVLSEKDPANLPWRDLGVEIVFECTGLSTTKSDLEKHIHAGAKHVILFAPEKGGGITTVVHGVNAADPNTEVISRESCTTNAITPVVEVVGRRIGVRKAMMTAVHAYTSSQAIVDGPAKKMRRGRAGAANLVPTSTGAAVATAKALPQYQGKFDGIAIRASIPVGSIADITFVTERATSVDQVNAIFREEAASNRYRGILGVAEDPIVSADIVKDPRAPTADLESTQVVDGDRLKVLSWYKNKWGYATQMVREGLRMAAQ
jgi:glyceraldehyde 3-phosphate dehydrogenase